MKASLPNDNGSSGKKHHRVIVTRHAGLGKLVRTAAG